MRRLRSSCGRAVALVVVPVALAACSAPDASPSGGSGARPAEEVRVALQETYDLTWGDPRTRHAAEVSTYVRHQERLARCLADRGSGHVPAPFLDATSPDPGPLSWYDPLVPVSADDGLLVPRQPEATEVPTSRTWPGRPPASADLGACVEGPTVAPAVGPELDEALYRMVTDALGADAEVAGYADCMAASGLEASGRDELVTAVLEQRPADDGPAPEEPAAAAADSACRAEAHRDAMAALDAPLADFARRHAERLADLGAESERVQQQGREDADRMRLDVSWW